MPEKLLNVKTGKHMSRNVTKDLGCSSEYVSAVTTYKTMQIEKINTYPGMYLVGKNKVFSEPV